MPRLSRRMRRPRRRTVRHEAARAAAFLAAARVLLHAGTGRGYGRGLRRFVDDGHCGHPHTRRRARLARGLSLEHDLVRGDGERREPDARAHCAARELPHLHRHRARDRGPRLAAVRAERNAAGTHDRPRRAGLRRGRPVRRLAHPHPARGCARRAAAALHRLQYRLARALRRHAVARGRTGRKRGVANGLRDPGGARAWRARAGAAHLPAPRGAERRHLADRHRPHGLVGGDSLRSRRDGAHARPGRPAFLRVRKLALGRAHAARRLFADRRGIRAAASRAESLAQSPGAARTALPGRHPVLRDLLLSQRALELPDPHTPANRLRFRFSGHGRSAHVGLDAEPDGDAVLFDDRAQGVRAPPLYRPWLRDVRRRVADALAAHHERRVDDGDPARALSARAHSAVRDGAGRGHDVRRVRGRRFSACLCIQEHRAANRDRKRNRCGEPVAAIRRSHRAHATRGAHDAVRPGRHAVDGGTLAHGRDARDPGHARGERESAFLARHLLRRGGVRRAGDSLAPRDAIGRRVPQAAPRGARTTARQTDRLCPATHVAIMRLSFLPAGLPPKWITKLYPKMFSRQHMGKPCVPREWFHTFGRSLWLESRPTRRSSRFITFHSGSMAAPRYSSR
ncbi:hypothetical protein PUN4_20128 [Paraburkholderia unamae]|nr:hypothetical protein PUN4_20128 [Paraburkholderia unamae]